MARPLIRDLDQDEPVKRAVSIALPASGPNCIGRLLEITNDTTVDQPLSRTPTRDGDRPRQTHRNSER